MADYKSEVTLNEKDSLQDMLNLEKQIIKMYSTAMTEGVSKGFRNTVKAEWQNAVEDQFDVYAAMTKNGYTQVESAPEDTILEQKNKFSKVRSQLN